MTQIAEELVVQISAQIADLQKGMQAGLVAVTESNAAMKASVDAAAASMQTAFVATGASAQRMGAEVQGAATVAMEGMEKIRGAAKGLSDFLLVGLGIGVAFEQFKKFGEAGIELQHLSDQTGISVEKLSQLRFAAESTHVPVEALQTGLAKLAKTMTAAHEGTHKALDSLAHFGITAADLHNPLFDMGDALDKIADKTAAQGDGFLKTGQAQEVFGRGAAQLIPLLNQGSDGIAALAKKSDDLGTTWNGKVQASAQQVNASLLRMHQAGEALRNTLAVSLSSAFSVVVNWFVESIRDGGTLRGILDGLALVVKVVASAFQVLYTAARDVISIIIVNVMHAVEVFRGWGAVIRDLMTGHVSRISADWADAQHEMKEASAVSASQIKENNEALASSLKAIWSDPATMPQNADAGKDSGNADTSDFKGKTAKSGGDKIYKDLRQQLERMEDEENISDEKRKQFELDFWTAKLAIAKHGSDEWYSILHEVHQLQREEDRKAAEEAKKQAQQAQEIDKIKVQSALQTENTIRDIKKIGIEEAYEYGQITKQQELKSLNNLENQRYKAESDELEKELALLDSKSVAWAQMNAKIEQINAQHEKILADQAKAEADYEVQLWKQRLQPITSSIQQSVNGMIAGTLTLRKALQNLLQSIVGEFVSMGAQMVTDWAAREFAKTSISRAQAAARAAAERLAQVTGLATQKALGVAAVTTEAAKAGAGGVASMAAAPWPLDMSAPAFGAAMFASAMAYMPAAAQGYDIPSGTNPITQLHQREMVLPAHLADAVREMAGRGGGGGGTQHHHYHISSPDARSFTDMLKRNPSAIAAAGQHMRRNGWTQA